MNGHKAAVSVVVVLGFLCGGCQQLGLGFNRGKISIPGANVQSVPDAGKPATASSSQTGIAIALAAGSRVVVTKYGAIPATAETPAVPEREETVIYPAGPTEYRKNESTVRADTGTVDTSIAAKKLEAQENRILLYGALAMVVAAGAFFWLHYPSPALMCGGAAVILFLAWKVSGMPDWFWGLAVLAGAGGIGLYFGHRRGLYEPVPDDKK